MTSDPTAVIHDDADDQTWERLARHLTGESPVDESAATVAWAAAEPERARLLESSNLSLALAQSEIAALPGAPAEGVRAEDAWPQVEARLAEDAPALSGPVSGSPPRAPRGASVSPVDGVRPIVLAPSERRRRQRRHLAGHALRAAGVAAVLGGAYLLVRAGDRPGVAEAPAAAAPPVQREYVTRQGQRAAFRLADGTRVILAPGSILRLRAGLTPDAPSGAREVTLEGEAFFDVADAAERPFAVVGAAGVARDLGTSFAVRSYGQERAMRVAVRSGFVSLTPAGPAVAPGPRPDTLLLRAGDAGEAVPGQAPTRLAPGQVAPLLAWTRDTLAFADAPLARVAQEIERWYAVTVEVPDTLLARERLTAVVPRGDVGEVLDVIALALGARSERVGARIVIRRQ